MRFVACFAVLSVVTSAALCWEHPCSPWLTVNITDAVIFSNKSAWDLDGDMLYPPHTYWLDTVDGRNHLYGCPCRLDRPCLRKCCGKKEAMDKDRQECVPFKKRWPWFRPIVSADARFNEMAAEDGDFGLLFGIPCLGYLLQPNEHPEDQFFLNFTDGTLAIPGIRKTGIDSSGFCLEYIPAVHLYLPYVCLIQIFPDQPLETCDKAREIVYPLGMAISIIFLLISLTIYSTTPELRNLHGKCLICHIVSLLSAYTFHMISRAIREDLSSKACRAMGFVIYYGLLCSFLWLNAICIDICVAFCHLRPSGLNHNEESAKKFLWYALYAWGFPLAVTSITAVIAFHPDLTDSFMGPEFRTICGFSRGKSRLIYFVVPMGIIVIFNIVLFIITSYKIYKVTRQTMILNVEDSAMSGEDRQRIKLFLKLLIVMGVSWVFGSWILELLNYFFGDTSCMWLFTDTMNTLQGLFIFLIFVWKDNVKKLMIKKMRSLASLLSRGTVIGRHNMESKVETSTTASEPNAPVSGTPISRKIY